MSVECQFLKLPEVLERSIVGLMIVLKSPAVMRLFEFDNMEKMLWKKDGSSLFGPYIFASVNVVWLKIAFIMMNLPSGSVIA